MSRKFVKQFASAKALFHRTLGAVFGYDVTVPTDGSSGWAPNALFLDLDATAGEGLLINAGTGTSCDFNPLFGSTTLATTAGAGVTGGTGTVYKTSVIKTGDIITTRILIDLTGLDSSGTAGDVVGLAAGGAAHLGQITTAQNGAIFAGTIRCLEIPTGGDPDVDFFAASVATGAFDDAASGLSGQSQLINTGDWTLEADTLTALPAANAYLYAVAGATDDATYTAGKFLIELYGY